MHCQDAARNVKKRQRGTAVTTRSHFSHDLFHSVDNGDVNVLYRLRCIDND